MDKRLHDPHICWVKVREMFLTLPLVLPPHSRDEQDFLWPAARSLLTYLRHHSELIKKGLKMKTKLQELAQR